MPVHGSLATMSLTEILQWLGNAGKTGTLSIERNKVVKRILVREGRLIACAYQDPADMLGHFLVSRGKISEETLRKALALQETQHAHLGRILVATGALSEDDLRLLLEDKAQETIFGLFGWDDAEFRFAEGETADPNIFAVNMRVDDILLRGAQRWDEMQRFRSVFNDPGIVLRRTARIPPADPRPRAVVPPIAAPTPAPAPSVVAEGDLEFARRLLNRGEFDSALEILDRAYKAQPGDEALRRLLAEAEASFVEKSYKHYLPPTKVVTLLRAVETLTAERLSPTEFFLLSRIDGTWDVKSIIQITPLREVDVLRTLKRMREKGLIELKDSVAASA